MPALAEPLNLGDLLKYEAPNLYSRDRVTVASGQNLPLGTVVGIVTATGQVQTARPVRRRRHAGRRWRAATGLRCHPDRP
jgi:hypothetical protein